MLTDEEQKTAVAITKEYCENLGRCNPELHGSIFKQIKDFTKERLLKEAAVRNQEAEAIHVFIKENMQ